MKRALLLWIFLQTAGCSEQWDWDAMSADDRETASCYVATEAADAWSEHGHPVTAECTGSSTVLIYVEGWYTELQFVDHEIDCGGVAANGCTWNGDEPRIEIAANSRTWVGADPNDVRSGLTWVAAHEIGHLLGFDHPEAPRVMSSRSLAQAMAADWPSVNSFGWR